MAIEIFLDIGGIKGESPDRIHKDEIDVLSWSWGISQSLGARPGPGGGTGKVSVQDLSITKYADKASPLLMRHCAKGTHIPAAHLTVRRAGHQLDYVKITLTDAIVSGVNTSGSNAEDRLTENVTLNFAKFKYEYTPQKATGEGDTPIPFEFDVAANKAAR